MSTRFACEICGSILQVSSMEGLAGQLRYPLRALFADAAVTLHGAGAVTEGPWLNAGARPSHSRPDRKSPSAGSHSGACTSDVSCDHPMRRRLLSECKCASHLMMLLPEARFAVLPYN